MYNEKLHKNKHKNKTIVWIIAIFLSLIAIRTIIEQDDENWNEKNNSIMAYVVMEDFVKERLKSPGSADFPGVSEHVNHTKYLGNQKYQIISWVDSQNSFGALMRTNFIGVIKQVSKDSWKLLSLNFVDR